MFPAIRAMLRDPEGKLLLAAALATLAAGTVAYTFLEGWSIIDSLYFSVVTLATVGFGDLHPTNDVSKLFTVGYILTGVGIIAGFVSQVPRYRHGNQGGDVATRLARVEERLLDRSEHATTDPRDPSR